MPGGGPAGRLGCKGRDHALAGAFPLEAAGSALSQLPTTDKTVFRLAAYLKIAGDPFGRPTTTTFLHPSVTTYPDFVPRLDDMIQTKKKRLLKN